MYKRQILKPAYVDEDSGYRYYTSNQLLPLHKILALRDMGFSLEEIRQVCNGCLLYTSILKTSENPIDKGNSEVFFFLRFSNDTIIFFLNSSDVMCRIKNEYLFFESKSQVP